MGLQDHFLGWARFCMTGRVGNLVTALLGDCFDSCFPAYIGHVRFQPVGCCRQVTTLIVVFQRI